MTKGRLQMDMHSIKTEQRIHTSAKGLALAPRDSVPGLVGAVETPGDAGLAWLCNGKAEE